MKKLILIGLAIAATACNSDDQDREECTTRVWGMTENCSTDGTDCVYVATYGETEEGAGSLITTQSTYNYYTALGNTNNGTVCWDGTKD